MRQHPARRSERLFVGTMAATCGEPVDSAVEEPRNTLARLMP
jgi:hypothetical protein